MMSGTAMKGPAGSATVTAYAITGGTMWVVVKVEKRRDRRV